MVEGQADRIHIRDLMCRCIVGIYPDERREKQDVIINITLWADYRAACRSDDIADTVDYKAIKKQVIRMVEDSSFQLIERLAEEIAGICLANPRVEKVAVSVDKPGALRFARSVAVEIVRARE
ncbi:MAG TPA: dihydroneopterin aldolase [Candidatus Hydrogenedentes bacterium]|jgi:FolB domain-containing protein|nr:dihydroneopterin aldolase [Candidatus Hydrogenedentota bacterium]NLT59894.1 dihydroneopterin aldolase [Candidatus Hydrogenedentota bacterium]HNV21313.1 dihydroneopterin aldolase [Candidatus Hydrogenedentota bacterium]HNZ18833.1 dihydroneopterin aldolase [Candidatus Hydrogenedentota bacterium]HOH34211.1 dihydroneopterin aldolase [Candidatus Hydrogenedentota bacterium]